MFVFKENFCALNDTFFCPKLTVVFTPRRTLTIAVNILMPIGFYS